MLTEPLYLAALLLAVVAAVYFLVNYEHKKLLNAIDEELEEMTRGLFHKLEHALGAESRMLIEHGDEKLDATADKLNQTIDVLRAAIEHQSRQQEHLVERLKSLESIVSGRTRPPLGASPGQ